jgi:hypothetical protein
MGSSELLTGVSRQEISFSLFVLWRSIEDVFFLIEKKNNKERINVCWDGKP